MFIPSVYPAEAVVEEAKLDVTQRCMCGQEVARRGKLCVFTHKVGEDEYNWYLSCDLACYAANVSDGAC